MNRVVVWPALAFNHPLDFQHDAKIRALPEQHHPRYDAMPVPRHPRGRPFFRPGGSATAGTPRSASP